MLAELKAFLFKGNVVDLAVAVVIGAAFKAVIDAFVAFIINPIIAAIFGQPDISRVLAIELREGAELLIGAFFQEVLNFAIIGTALFVVVKTFNELQKRRAAGEEVDESTPSDEVVVLNEIRDLLATRG